jgi:predicted transglutaminase-like cysteine proteinase
MILRGTHPRYAVPGLLTTLLLFAGHARAEQLQLPAHDPALYVATTVTDRLSPVVMPTVSSDARLASRRPVLAPGAFMRFCARYPQDCEERRGEFANSAPALSGPRLTELVEINREVNRLIAPQTNRGGVIAEEWELSPRSGDCSDYAVTKRHLLLARGWPSSSLLLAEAVLSSGDHHLVLVVRMHEVDLVLDNVNTQLRPAALTGYRWIRAQHPDNPKFWSTIDLSKPARVTMN